MKKVHALLTDLCQKIFSQKYLIRSILSVMQKPKPKKEDLQFQEKNCKRQMDGPKLLVPFHGTYQIRFMGLKPLCEGKYVEESTDLIQNNNLLSNK